MKCAVRLRDRVRSYLGTLVAPSARSSKTKGKTNRLGFESLEPRELMSLTGPDLSGTLSRAVQLGQIGEAITRTALDAIQTVRGVDLWGFDVAAAGATFTFQATRSGASRLDTYVRLFNANGSALAANNNGAPLGQVAGTNSYLSYTFAAAGRYYVGVSAAGNNYYLPSTGLFAFNGRSVGTYQLSVANLTPVDGAGNTLAAAKSLGTVGNATKGATDWVGRVDTNDYYSFSLSQTSDVSLTLSGLKADADLQLICDANGNKKVDAGETLANPAVRGTGAETVNRQLAAGTYFVRVARVGGETTYSLSVTARDAAVPPSPSTFLGLKDAGLASLTQSLFVDKSIGRSDMMSILRSAGSDDNLVDAIELTDLKTILGNATYLAMPDYVRVLASDVVFGSLANANYQGAALGNLAAGSSAGQLNKLVDKWFLGADRPDSGGYAYRTFAGQLFVGRPQYTDIYQGYLGDCYLMATLGSIAKGSPGSITGMFIDNGDSTYTVRFYDSAGRADYVTVDRMLPTTSSGRPIYAGVQGSASSTNAELWAALVEKAYVQWNETGKTGRSEAANRYASIAGGWMADVDAQVLGHAAASYYLASQSMLVNAINAGGMVTLGSYSNPGNGIVGGHAYMLSGYNASTGTYTLYNPWGSYQPGAMTWAQLQQSFFVFTVAFA